MSAIAAYRTAVLELLSDSTNIIFTNNNVDQGLRWALTEYSFRRPLIRTYQFSVVAATRVHILPVDFVTRHITKVELWNANADLITEQVFYAYKSTCLACKSSYGGATKEGGVSPNRCKLTM
jgi:hypothetical protein